MDRDIKTFGIKIQLYFPDLEVEFCFPRGNPEAIHTILIWRKKRRVATVLRHFSGSFRVSADESPDWNMVREMDYNSALEKTKRICSLVKTISK